MIKPCHGCGKLPDDCNCQVRYEFLDRCMSLDRALTSILSLECSSRVKVSVLSELIAEIIIEDRDPDDPNGGLDQVIAVFEQHRVNDAMDKS